MSLHPRAETLCAHIWQRLRASLEAESSCKMVVAGFIELSFLHAFQTIPNEGLLLQGVLPFPRTLAQQRDKSVRALHSGINGETFVTSWAHT